MVGPRLSVSLVGFALLSIVLCAQATSPAPSNANANADAANALFTKFKSVTGPRPGPRPPLSRADLAHASSHYSKSRAMKPHSRTTSVANPHSNLGDADLVNKLFPNASAAHDAEAALLTPPSGASLPPITVPLQRTKERAATAAVLGNTVLVNGSMIEFGVYYMDVTVGPYPLAVTVDTGSAFLAVEDKLCSNCVSAPGQTPYDWWASTSSLNIPCAVSDCFSCATEEAVQDIAPCGFQVGYGDGTGLSGAVAYDFITLGNYGTFALFGRILTNINHFMEEVPQAQGILGLAYPDLGCTPSCVLPLMWQYYTDGLLPNFVFGMCMGPSSGAFDIGYVDSSKALGPIQYTPLLNTQFYEIGLQSIALGSTVLPVDLSAYRVIVDSGTTLMVVPEPVLTAFMAELVASGPPSVATFGTVSTFVAPCSSAGLIDPTGYPTMQFNFDGATLQLAPEQYLLSVGNMTCLGMASFPLATSSPNPLLVLGQSFLSAFYTVYDVQRSQVGFAPTSPAACAGTLPGQCGGGCRHLGASSDCERVRVQSQSTCVSLSFDPDANTCN